MIRARDILTEGNMEPKQLARLSTSVTQALRSNVIIRSLGQAVEECVQNSLDAKASQIFVEVDLALMGARVEDNGCGIDQQGLHMMGNRYCTSKLRSLEELHTTGVETLGFRGEALSSIAAVAAVSILSRPRCQFETYYKTFKDGQTVSSGISSKHRASCGTTVCIRDFLHTESVGRRHAINSRHKLLHDVKTRILRILFIHPEVHFILSDASNKAELLRSLGTGSSLDIIYKTFGAHLEGAMREIHHEAMSASSRVVVSGYASDSSSGHTSRELQYLYINRRPVSCCSLYKLINCFFVAEISLGTRFGGGKQRGDEEHELEVAPRGAKVSPTAASTCGGVTQPRHGMCKLYPIFFINVELPATDCDITFNVDKSHAEFRSEHEVSRFVKQALQSLWRSKAEPEIIPREDPRDGGALPNKNTFSNQVRRSATLKCNQLSKKPARSMGIGKHPFGTRTEELETALLGPVENKFYSKSSGTADYRLHRTSMLLQLTPPGSPLRFPSQVPQVPLTSLDSPVTCGRAVRSPWLGPPSPATACDGVAWNDSDNRRGPHAFEESYVLPLTPKRCAAQPTTMDNSNRRSSKRRLIWKTTGTEQDDHHDAEPGGSWDGNSYASLSVDIDHEQSKCAIGTDLFLSETSPRHQLPLRNPPCLPSTSDDSRSGMFRLTLTTDEQAQHKHLDIDICSSYFQDDAPTNANTAFPSATPSAPRASVVSVSPAEEAIAQGHTGPNSDSPRKRSLVEKRYKGDAPPGPAPRIDDDQQVGGGDDGTSVPVCYKKWKAQRRGGSNKREAAILTMEQFDVETMPSRRGGKQPLPDRRRRAQPAATKGRDDDEPNAASGLPHQQAAWDLSTLHVIGQVDRKFVAVTVQQPDGLGRTLLLVDQHAADERIRVEALQESFLRRASSCESELLVPGDEHAALANAAASAPATAAENAPRKVLCPAQKLAWTPEEEATWMTHRAALERWGWRCRGPGDDDAAGSGGDLHDRRSRAAGAGGVLLVVEVPVVEGKPLSPADLREHLQEVAATMCGRTPPPAALRVLNSKACRGAVMFGDALRLPECASLARQLARTRWPFQCAHGRPTMCPVVDLRALHANLARGSALQEHHPTDRSC